MRFFVFRPQQKANKLYNYKLVIYFRQKNGLSFYLNHIIYKIYIFGKSLPKSFRISFSFSMSCEITNALNIVQFDLKDCCLEIRSSFQFHLVASQMCYSKYKLYLQMWSRNRNPILYIIYSTHYKTSIFFIFEKLVSSYVLICKIMSILCKFILHYEFFH